MAQVFPLLGIHYQPRRLEQVTGSSRLEDVIGPPYDVISPEEQDALYAASPYNFVRIMLNRAEPGDGPLDPYQRAARCLDDWLAQGILTEDTDPAYYVYRQQFTSPADGARRLRTGLFCALQLEPYSAGVVLPHEETRLKAKEDRLQLMRATRSNPEPIFGLYEDPERKLLRAIDASLESDDALLSAAFGAETHQVWRLGEPSAVDSIRRFFADRRIWIADGHHRYETALAYQAEQHAAGDAVGQQRSDTLLIVLTAFEDPGIVVLPTHRLVKNVSPARMEQLLLQIERFFVVEETDLSHLPNRMVSDPARADHRFGLVTANGAWVLSLREFSLMDAAVRDHPRVWKELDVSILQTLILDRSLGISAATLATTPDIGYTRSWDEALAAVAEGEYQIALLLNDPSADEVRRVAGVGDKMPPKSTFFYPKLWSGLIMQRL